MNISDLVMVLRALKLLVDQEIDEPRGLGFRLSGLRFRASGFRSFGFRVWDHRCSWQ